MLGLCIKEEKVKSNMKASFLPGLLGTDMCIYTVPFFISVKFGYFREDLFGLLNQEPDFMRQ